MEACGGSNSAPDVVLGGTSSTNDDGVLASDPSYTGSDIGIYSNDRVWVDLDDNNDGTGEFFQIRGGDDVELFRITEVGNLSVKGTISKGGGSFKIDHPLDPENKYLYHSFVESPDMKNIYDGNVVHRRARLRHGRPCPTGSRRSTATSATSSRCIGGGSPRSYIARGDRRQPLPSSGPTGRDQGLLAGHRHPPGRLRQRAPHPGRGGQARGRARGATCTPRRSAGRPSCRSIPSLPSRTPRRTEQRTDPLKHRSPHDREDGGDLRNPRGVFRAVVAPGYVAVASGHSLSLPPA